ncbi:hypothetical protein TPE_0515 [Treponema pedis str. T A4]|uniref:Uncharacterized protein n=1 Tax=Treponema pedis str. T A4 TaxID=1291379 RepID=S6A2W0_9SPIR|nr:hypothetical protein TPE_0515 [Treponema pedis str. T A4]
MFTNRIIIRCFAPCVQNSKINGKLRIERTVYRLSYKNFFEGIIKSRKKFLSAHRLFGFV